MSSAQPTLLDHEYPEQIRSRPCPACYLCGAPGVLLYEGVNDRLFGAPGIWNFRRCPGLACGLLWLDPMPVEEDISKAYAKYYTHVDVPRNAQKSSVHVHFTSVLRIVRDLLLRATLISGERERLALMYLDKMPPGRVLDVGCGDGSRLARLRALGWQVMGQEMDPKAAAHASQSHGVQVHLGPLDDADFGAAEFDAIVMNHVIEHVHDPVHLLTTCVRLLKKGGVLIAVTPNSESSGHKKFGASWRGLEPPRHVHLFSQRTIRKLADIVGFREINTWTTPAHAEVLANGSLDTGTSSHKSLSLGPRLIRRVASLQYQFRWQIAHAKNRNSGEECVLKAAT